MTPPVAPPPAPLAAATVGRRGQSGYTIVEVMMALAVLTLSISGVMAMQKATGIANTNARNLATANVIAQAWMERMRVDALAWNEQAGTNDISQTQWLNTAASSAPTQGAGWAAPSVNNFANHQPAGSDQQDVTGADIYDNNDPFATGFCTQVRLTRLLTAAIPQMQKSVRVEVRVVWDRSGQQITCNSLPSGWDTNTAVSGQKQYGAVYLVSAVSANAAPF